MNNREYKLVDSNLLELVNNNIISSEQYKEANNYINKTRKKSVDYYNFHGNRHFINSS